ncbi:DUF1877 family protein [Streptomyces sp. NPDC007157]|uniref:DUF1877 family protein n=1 Tax=Streptomyces sp. NPDC007157 TaxID=3154681 RepID=UPI0033CACB09
MRASTRWCPAGPTRSWPRWRPVVRLGRRYSDWGYGPPQYLTLDRVRLAAEILHQTAYDQLIQGVDPSELTRAEIYPQIWDSSASLDSARHLFTPLTEFFRGAASTGHAMLIWID